MMCLLLLLLWPSASLCALYNVTPDYPNTTCRHYLRDYLHNITQYFAFNTKFLFLLGLHHLHTDLIIQNVRNISLIGSSMISGDSHPM